MFLADEHSLNMTVSAGVATFPSARSVDSPDALIRIADQALYRAKQDGRNRVVDAGDGAVAKTKTSKKGGRRLKTHRVRKPAPSPPTPQR